MDLLYNIVWADDNVQTLLQDNRMLFEREGFAIIPFTEAEPAIKYIRENSSFVDAVITDAKFARRQGETFQEEGTSFPGLSEFVKSIDGLRRETGNPLPCWIFTGYGDLLWQKYDKMDLEGFNNVVDKKADYSTIKTWVKEIQSVVFETKTEAFRIRQENPECFALCTDEYIGKKCEKTMLDILAYKQDEETIPFNRFRDILEEVLDLLVRKGFIGGLTEKISIDTRIRNFSNAKGKKIPKYIIPTMEFLACSSPLSHSDSVEKDEIRAGHAPFMYETLLMSMKTILAWLKPFIDSAIVSTEVVSSQTGVAQAETNQRQQKAVVSTSSFRDTKIEDTEVGILKTKAWWLQVEDGKYVDIGWKLIKGQGCKAGQKLRVRIAKDPKGNDVVTEIVGVEKR